MKAFLTQGAILCVAGVRKLTFNTPAMLSVRIWLTINKVQLNTYSNHHRQCDQNHGEKQILKLDRYLI